MTHETSLIKNISTRDMKYISYKINIIYYELFG